MSQENKTVEQLIPLSHLDLDLTRPPAGWRAMLKARGVEIVADDIGRPSIARSVVGELIAEAAERAAERDLSAKALRRKMDESHRLIRQRPRTPAEAAPLELNWRKP